MFKRQTHRRSTVAIKRVIAQGGTFICGVCRKTYQDHIQANQCLDRCLGQHLNPTNPVVSEPGAGPKKYRCHFCRRVYLERDKAVECAAACRQQTTAAVQSEHPVAAKSQQAGLTLVSSAPSASQAEVERKSPVVRRDQMHKFFRDGRKLICRKCGAEKKTLDDVIACYDSHPEKVRTEPVKKLVVSPKAAAPKPSKPAPADVVPVDKAPRNPGLTNEDDKFLRDGARYVCRQCNNKFFTRGDVVACYDGHQGASAPVVEVKPDPAPVKAAPAVASSAPGLTNEDDKFFRDGARYICRICQKKHFTRGDVFACFDSHSQ